MARALLHRRNFLFIGMIAGFFHAHASEAGSADPYAIVLRQWDEISALTEPAEPECGDSTPVKAKSRGEPAACGSLAKVARKIPEAPLDAGSAPVPSASPLPSASPSLSPVRELVRRTYERVRAAVLARANALPDSPEKSRVLASLARVHLIEDCADDSVWNALYYSEKDTISVCGGIANRADTSPFVLEFSIAHEFGHLFEYAWSDRKERDPAKIALPKALNDCLRGPDGANARYADDDALLKAAKKMKDYGITSEMNGPLAYRDQLSETFGDYFAAELVPDLVPADLDEDGYAYGYATIFQGAAEISKVPLARRYYRKIGRKAGKRVYLDHLLVKDRLDRVIAANPRVRAQLGCSSLAHSRWHYCGSLESHFATPAGN